MRAGGVEEFDARESRIPLTPPESRSAVVRRLRTPNSVAGYVSFARRNLSIFPNELTSKLASSSPLSV